MEIKMVDAWEEFREKARSGKIPPHTLYAMDIYRTPKDAQLLNASIDVSRKYDRRQFPLPLRAFAPSEERFFSGTIYEMRNLIGEEEEETFDTLEEAVTYLKQNDIGKINVPSERPFDVEEIDGSLYVSRGLSEQESKEIQTLAEKLK